MHPVKKPVVMKLVVMKPVPIPDTNNLNEYSDLTVFVINFRSILNKKGEFLLFLQNVKPHIIIGTETWLSKDILDNEIIPITQSIGKTVMMAMEVF